MTARPAGKDRPRLRIRLFHAWFLLRRPMTLGARAVVHDARRNAVFLVRHTYVAGWHLPGGGVEPGETIIEALTRELMEEGNIEMAAPPVLRSLHFNRGASRRDHVAIYLVTDFRQNSPRIADREIAEAGFFPLDALPEGLAPATGRRLAEIFDGAPVSEEW